VAGALIGAVAGSLIGHELDEADKRRAQTAAQDAASDGRRITWSSEKQPNVSGYAEPAGPVYERQLDSPLIETQFCYDTTANLKYVVTDRPCSPGDRVMTEAEYRNRVPISSQTSEAPKTVTPAAMSGTPAGVSCRKVREVVIIDGTERRQESEYCLGGGQWHRV